MFLAGSENGTRQSLRRARLSLAFVAMLCLSAFGQAASQPSTHQQHYKISELPLRPLAISQNARVAGTTEDQHAAVWDRKTGLSRIALPPEFTFSEATGINSRGEAVGTASTADYNSRIGFLLRDDQVTILPSQQTRANAINDSGDIVGQAVLSGGKAASPVLWKNGAPLDLKICCAGVARDVSAQGLVAGDTYDSAGQYHAFLWDSAHGAHLLNAPEEEYSTVVALNGRGDVLLKSSPGGLFLYSGGKFQPVEIPKATPRAMNNSGITVGSFGPNPDAQRAFVWSKEHGMRDLNELLPAGSGWTLEVASGINDRGEIIGWGDHGGKDNAGFLLTPDQNESHNENNPTTHK